MNFARRIQFDDNIPLEFYRETNNQYQHSRTFGINTTSTQPLLQNRIPNEIRNRFNVDEEEKKFDVIEVINPLRNLNQMNSMNTDNRLRPSLPHYYQTSSNHLRRPLQDSTYNSDRLIIPITR